MSVEIQAAQTLLGQQSGDHHEAEHHRQQEIKEIVARIDGRYPDPDGE